MPQHSQRGLPAKNPKPSPAPRKEKASTAPSVEDRKENFNREMALQAESLFNNLIIEPGTSSPVSGLAPFVSNESPASQSAEHVEELDELRGECESVRSFLAFEDLGDREQHAQHKNRRHFWQKLNCFSSCSKRVTEKQLAARGRAAELLKEINARRWEKNIPLIRFPFQMTDSALRDVHTSLLLEYESCATSRSTSGLRQQLLERQTSQEGAAVVRSGAAALAIAQSLGADLTTAVAASLAVSNLCALRKKSPKDVLASMTDEALREVTGMDPHDARAALADLTERLVRTGSALTEISPRDIGRVTDGAVQHALQEFLGVPEEDAREIENDLAQGVSTFLEKTAGAGRMVRDHDYGASASHVKDFAVEVAEKVDPQKLAGSMGQAATEALGLPPNTGEVLENLNVDVMGFPAKLRHLAAGAEYRVRDLDPKRLVNATLDAGFESFGYPAGTGDFLHSLNNDLPQLPGLPGLPPRVGHELSEAEFRLRELKLPGLDPAQLAGSTAGAGMEALGYPAETAHALYTAVRETNFPEVGRAVQEAVKSSGQYMADTVRHTDYHAAGVTTLKEALGQAIGVSGQDTGDVANLLLTDGARALGGGAKWLGSLAAKLTFSAVETAVSFSHQAQTAAQDLGLTQPTSPAPAPAFEDLPKERETEQEALERFWASIMLSDNARRNSVRSALERSPLPLDAEKQEALDDYEALILSEGRTNASERMAADIDQNRAALETAVRTEGEDSATAVHHRSKGQRLARHAKAVERLHDPEYRRKDRNFFQALRLVMDAVSTRQAKRGTTEHGLDILSMYRDRLRPEDDSSFLDAALDMVSLEHLYQQTYRDVENYGEDRMHESLAATREAVAEGEEVRSELIRQIAVAGSGLSITLMPSAAENYRKERETVLSLVELRLKEDKDRAVRLEERLQMVHSEYYAQHPQRLLQAFKPKPRPGV